MIASQRGQRRSIIIAFPFREVVQARPLRRTRSRKPRQPLRADPARGIADVLTVAGIGCGISIGKPIPVRSIYANMTLHGFPGCDFNGKPFGDPAGSVP